MTDQRGCGLWGMRMGREVSNEPRHSTHTHAVTRFAFGVCWKRFGLKGPDEIVPMFDTRDLAAALVCLAERSPLHQR